MKEIPGSKLVICSISDGSYSNCCVYSTSRKLKLVYELGKTEGSNIS